MSTTRNWRSAARPGRRRRPATRVACSRSSRATRRAPAPGRCSTATRDLETRARRSGVGLAGAAGVLLAVVAAAQDRVPVANALGGSLALDLLDLALAGGQRLLRATVVLAGTRRPAPQPLHRVATPFGLAVFHAVHLAPLGVTRRIGIPPPQHGQPERRQHQPPRPGSHGADLEVLHGEQQTTQNYENHLDPFALMEPRL